VLEDWDDGQLMAALREARQARQAVPAAFVETAKAAYAWHNIDAELAQLSYDSSVDAEQGALVRSEAASVRTLTFSSPRMSVELEVADETQTRTGAAATVEIDVTGCFSIEPIPESPFRLRCRTTDGLDVVTGWITL
jgi:hypothetical protein